MTIRHRKRPPQHDDSQAGPIVNEPALQIECDSCLCDLTHSVRIRCADPVCDSNAIDICPDCFCKGKEFGRHRRGHPYRVVEKHSYPIFTEDWGADEELLLLEGLSLSGMGNWAAAAEHIGTRTKQEVEHHYSTVYVESPDWPLPNMHLEFDIKPEVFQQRKRRRIEELTRNPPPPHPSVQNSAPTNHEIAGYMPGRLEFEHEIDNDAEDLIKDLEFGLVYQWGGQDQIEDPEDVKTRADAYKARAAAMEKIQKQDRDRSLNGFHHDDLEHPKEKDEEKIEIPPLPDPVETRESIQLKLSLLEAYQERIERRLEGKAMILERGLLEYKKMQAADKKRPKEEREFLQKYKPFAKLQTAEDHEVFTEGLLYEQSLRRRIAELQESRRVGLTTFIGLETYEKARMARLAGHRTISRDAGVRPGIRNGSQSNELKRSFSAVDSDNKKSVLRTGRKAVGPLNLASAPSLHLLSPAEQTLCSQLRILPKPYLAIKETIVREFLKRHGNLKRREARDLVKCDVNKTSRVWDFLVQAGILKLPEGFNATLANGIVPSFTTAPIANGIGESTPLLSSGTFQTPEQDILVQVASAATPPP